MHFLGVFFQMDTRKQIDENCLTHFPDVFAPFITQNLNVKQKP